VVCDASSPGLFVYGTLLFPDVVRALVGREPQGRHARLPGFARRSIRGELYPAIVPSPAAETPGLVYVDLDATALMVLDRFEGDLYERRLVEAALEDGGRMRVFAYVIAATKVACLDDEPWDPSEFAARHLRAYVLECQRLRVGLA
jgi:gamma-glutamylcyclotransferase (GGCT)/AIG2-like uncharacterized protein YtfP